MEHQLLLNSFSRWRSLNLAFACALSCTLASAAFADGTETLGPASVAIAPGSGYVVAGAGLLSQPGAISINVPGSVKQVLLYWEGYQTVPGAIDPAQVQGDATIVINGVEYTGTRIGGPTAFFETDFGNAYSETFRVDLTAAGLITSGPNSLTVEGLDFNFRNNGAGLLVIYDDGSGLKDIQIVDGNDQAYLFFNAPLDTTVPQTFTFAASDVDRTADLGFFASSVLGEENVHEHNALAVSIDGGPATLHEDFFQNLDGFEWDSPTLSVIIPAGATSLTVQVLSINHDFGDGSKPASLAWIGAAFSIAAPPPPPPPPVAFCPRTPGYWKNHLEAWPVSSFIIGDVSYNTNQLLGFLSYGGPDMSMHLAKHLTATMLNLASGSSTSIETVVSQADAFLAANPPGSNPKGALKGQAESLKNQLDAYNNSQNCDALEENTAVAAKPGKGKGRPFAQAGMPAAFSLDGAYPNPFNTSTNISFTTPAAGAVTVTVYDMLGRQVQVVVNTEFAAGSHRIVFDAGNLPSGTYLYRVQTEFGVATGRLMLLR